MYSRKINLLSLFLVLSLCLLGGQPLAAKEVSRVEVDLSTQLVRVYRGDELLRMMICSTGAAGSETPEGSFAIQNKGYMFTTEGDVSAKYYTSFKGWGQYMFHTILYNKNGTRQIASAYKKLGRPASHGCIRLNVYDAKWIQANLPQGIPVKIYRSGKPRMVFKNLALTYNGKPVSVSAPLRIIDNQPYIRATSIAKALGASLNYADETITLEWQGKKLQYRLSHPYVNLDGTTTTSTTAPQLFYEGSYLPLVSLCKAFALEFDTDSYMNTINLYTQDWLPIYYQQKQLSLERAPVFRNGSIYVAARPLAGQLGCQINWADNQLTISNSNNSHTFASETDLIIVNDQAFLRIRSLTDAFGYKIVWNKHQVNID